MQINDVTLAKALLAQIDVNFALVDALLQTIIEAKLPETEALKNSINDVSKCNQELIEFAKNILANASKE